MIKFLKNPSGGAITPIKPNIFLQEEEPETKEGIWLQSSDLTFDNIAIDESVISEKWTLSNVEVPAVLKAIIPIDENTLFCITSLSEWCLYNIDEKTYSSPIKISEPSVMVGAMYGIWAVIINDIFYYSSNDKIYKYDYKGNQSAELVATALYDMGHAAYTVIGDNIYFFHGYYAKNQAYKFNITTNEFTQLANPLHNALKEAKAIAVDSIIYLIYRGDSSGNKTLIIDTYNVDSNEYTNLVDLSGQIYTYLSDVVLFENNFYFIGSYDNSETQFAKYNILDNTLTELERLPDKYYQGDEGCVCAINDNIYMFKSHKNYIMSMDVKDYPNNSIIISQGGNDKKTQLLGNVNVTGRLLQYFHDVWHYTTENKLNETIPTYYGDSTKWIKFKN